MKSKGQTSLEFITMLSFIMLAFAAFYGMFVTNQAAALEDQRALFAEAIADQAAFDLNLALAQGDGFERNTTLPDSIGGFPYNVSVADRTVVVRWDDIRRVSAATAVPTVTGGFEPGDNTVSNQGGVIHVE